MPLTSTKRLVKTGFTNFFRNIWLSLAATSIMTLTLFIISTIFVLYTLTNLSLENMKDQVGITAYFNDQTSEREILNVKAELELLPTVEKVTYIPSSEAREVFRENHKDEPLWLETLGEFNSDEALPNSFDIRARNLEDYLGIAERLKSDKYAPYFERIRDGGKVIDTLFLITNTIKNLGVALTVVFVLVTIMVMFNTIRLTIYNRRQEVEIMRLVGATNAYIRMPFIIEGILYGLIAKVLTSLIMFAALYATSDKIKELLSLESVGGSLTNAYMAEIVLINLILGVGLGVVASSIAIRRYLRI